MSDEDCVVLYSGGTDSTAAAAVLAQRFARVRLLTFVEWGTRDSPLPTANVVNLRRRFGAETFTHELVSTDRLVRHLSYDRYGHYLRRHGLFLLAHCGFSSLSWHARAIAYCLDHGIRHAADGLTRELLHFPGHMDGVLDDIRALYGRFGIEYSNPVREWPVPPNQTVMDRLVVDLHLAEAYPEPGGGRTTGAYLHGLGLMPAPDVKGTALDRSMQHDCYPFVLFNLFVFWYFLPFHEYPEYERRTRALFREKISDLGALLSERAAAAELFEPCRPVDA